MVEGRLRVINPLGLHARAAAQLVRLSSGFASSIHLFRPESGVMADAKSILSVLTLAAAVGSELQLRVEGSDEQAAFDAVAQLFERGFGEI